MEEDSYVCKRLNMIFINKKFIIINFIIVGLLLELGSFIFFIGNYLILCFE